MSLTFRKAEIEDVELLFKWANDPLVREASFHSCEIVLEDHIAWFTDKISKEHHLLIFESNGIPAGIVRTEKLGEVTIGISIDSSFRGKKLAPQMLTKACEEYWQNSKEPIFAYIKSENIASQKSFSKAGFIFEREDSINNCKCVVFKINKS